MHEGEIQFGRFWFYHSRWTILRLPRTQRRGTAPTPFADVCCNRSYLYKLKLKVAVFFAQLKHLILPIRKLHF